MERRQSLVRRCDIAVICPDVISKPHRRVHMFNFAEYGQSIENMTCEWYKHTANVLQQSSDLGYAREHFIKNVLASFLPRSVIIGSGSVYFGNSKSGHLGHGEEEAGISTTNPLSSS